jgi:FkbM family methyltransferase|tara:strand:+ start:15 stop:755 length:741 start_codon:yes stop_codon:yes gene_type:complete
MKYDPHRERSLSIDIFREDIVENYDKIALFVDETIDQSFYNTTTSEIINTLELDENSVVIDLGTNLGDQMEDYVHLGAEVHSFEPHPMFANLIKKRFAKYQNLIFHNCAAGPLDNDEAYLYFRESSIDMNDGASMFHYKGCTDKNIELRLSHDPSVCHKTKTVDIAKYIFELDKDIDILKIDVEGYEYMLMWRLLQTDVISRIKHIFFADHRQDIFAPSWFAVAAKTIDVIKRNPDVMNKMHHRHA